MSQNCMSLGCVKFSGHCPCTEEPEIKHYDITLSTNLIPSGVHVREFILKVCVLLENTTEQESDPMCVKVLFSVES